jgi:hypothetical protein
LDQAGSKMAPVKAPVILGETFQARGKEEANNNKDSEYNYT